MEITPQKTRKFLKAAVIGLVEEGLTYYQAEELLRRSMYAYAKRKYRGKQKAVKALGVSRNFFRWTRTRTRAKSEEKPQNPEIS